MRIISKYKDYYDYYQGIFGIDNNRLYNRKNVVRYKDLYLSENSKEEHHLYFFICGKQYKVLHFQGKFYHTVEELEELNNIIRKEKQGNTIFTFRRRNSKSYYEANNGIEVDYNIKRREPVLFAYRSRYSTINVENLSVPLLKDFDVHKIIDAKTLYIEIETFLGWLVDNPPIPDNQTNIGKIEGHGFDRKTSFRPKMKDKHKF